MSLQKKVNDLPVFPHRWCITCKVGSSAKHDTTTDWNNETCVNMRERCVEHKHMYESSESTQIGEKQAYTKMSELDL